MRDGQIVQATDPQTLYREPVDADVAGFVGEAILLSGRLEKGVAETSLGPLRIREPAGALSGEATVMLRPEQIACHPASPSDPVQGQVLSTEFYGHDATARIVLTGTDEEILARAAGHQLPEIGEQVGIVVEGPASAFVTAAAAQASAAERLSALG